MVEYTESLRGVLSSVTTFQQATIPLPVTPFVMSNKYGQLAAFVLHGIDVCIDGLLTTDGDIQDWYLSKASKSQFTMYNDPDIIECEKKFCCGIEFWQDCNDRINYVPPILLSQQNLYFGVVCTRSSTVAYRLRYTIRMVDRESFVNALVPAS